MEEEEREIKILRKKEPVWWENPTTEEGENREEEYETVLMCN